MWQQWVNGILGIGIMIVPFLGLTATQNTWTLVIGGLAIAVLGFWGATEHGTVHEHHGSMSHA